MHEFSIAGFLASLLVILLSAKIFGKLAERLRQPAVLGELLSGVVLGLGLFPFFHPHDPVLSLLAQCGVVMLLFETGLESDLSQLMKVGPMSVAVACVGVALPFVGGYAAMAIAGHSGLSGVLVGAAMTATSVGITARVLADLGQLHRQEAQIILGAAVVDDILGIVILAVVQGAAAQGHVAWMRIASTALIIGAFAAGILLARTPRQAAIRSALKPVSAVVVPIFFVMVGAEVDVRAYAPWTPGNWPMLGFAALLVLIAVVSKMMCGWAAWRQGLNRWAIGVGMVPRGEVGLVFAQVGLTAGVIAAPLYAALIGMVVVTTFVTPPMLKRVLLEKP